MTVSTPSFSFELFPPRTPEGAAKLPAMVARLAAAGPDFFSVTFGAGGSAQEGTYDTVVSIAHQTGVPTAPHLTCVGSTRARIAELLARYREAGVRRIVALRGDLPATSLAASAPGELRYASELVRYIRELHDEHFEIHVAAYPEMHPQARDPASDLAFFVEKVRAGAHAAITQYFFVAEAYFEFVERCDKARLGVPVVPGIMPIVNGAQLLRFSEACGADVPRWIRLRLQQYADDRASLQAFGFEVVGRLCETLLAAGAPGLHFYTINQAEPSLRLWRQLRIGSAATATAL